MDKIGMTLLFVFMAFCGLKIFKREKYINKIGGMFWMIIGAAGAIMMVIKLLSN